MNQDFFTVRGLTEAVNAIQVPPLHLNSLNLFTDKSLDTTFVKMDTKNGQIVIVPTTARGGTGTAHQEGKRTGTTFDVPHLALRHTLSADDVQNVKQFGNDSQAEGMGYKLTDCMEDMKTNIAVTIEANRLLALTGSYKGDNDETINLYTQMGVSQSTVNFSLATAATEPVKKAIELRNAMKTGFGGSPKAITVVGSSSFMEKLACHKNFEKYFLNTAAASTLLDGSERPVSIKNITFIEYSGSANVDIEDGCAYAFPTNLPKLFMTYYAPADYTETVNTMALPFYASKEVLSHNKGFEIEVQSNPLSICLQPKAIIKLVAS